MTTVDFEAVNARGITLRTFTDLDLAKRWVRENADRHEGLHVDEVTHTVTRRRAFRPQIRLAS